ncbi:sensor histidine kinase [Lysobacter sp. D1-1-M9]|uniref:sensor histidine kinase n=1 Tax=Novilysobacter longmucuonensis TaxID=3098603 RepID=UPI002FC78DEE
MKRPSRLRNRLLLAMSGLVLATSAVFSLYTLAFTYAVEDTFLAARLQEEAGYQSAERARTGAWSISRDPKLQLHESEASLPTSVRELLRREPRRVEFPGPLESHFHLLPLDAPDGARAWLLYDAGADLIVPAMRDKLLALLAVTTGLLVACALAVAFLVSWRVARRLERLAASVSAFSPDRIPASLSQVAGNDEVGVVAASLDAMSTRLQAYVERERRFTRDASHELRTPLAVIRSAGDQLARQPELGPTSRGHATLICESTMRLEQMVATLLAVAREDRSEMGFDSVTLLPLVEQAVIDQSARLDGKPVEVDVEVPATACLRTPETVARILLANLVGNAFAHTAAGRVRIDTDAGALRVVNSLTGIFLPGEPQSGQHSTSVDGFGFGLDIVRRLSERFDLGFELVAEGGDVVATLTLADSNKPYARKGSI